MEKLSNIIRIIIIGIMAIISTIIITIYIGIIASIAIIFLLFILLYLLNKKYDIELPEEKSSSKKVNIILAIILFLTALTVRLLLVKLLKISPESDFALLIDASKNLAARQQYIKYFTLLFMLGLPNWVRFISNCYYKNVQ